LEEERHHAMQAEERLIEVKNNTKPTEEKKTFSMPILIYF